MEQIKEWLVSLQMSEGAAEIVLRTFALILTVCLTYLMHLFARRFLLNLVERLAKQSQTEWDDILLKRKVFHRLAHLAPALVIYFMAPLVFESLPQVVTAIRFTAQIYAIIIGMLVIDAFLNAVVDIYRTFEFARRMPIRGFVQVIKIGLYSFIAILILAKVMGQKPGVMLGGLGAMTAVIMLIFKDAILGFVAGIQLSTNKMVHIGDWIEMPNYGADGDVIDISLTTVKVQNWDKTIASIPTYALVTNSFKNWRGMSESGGRRIKRSINIDMTSVKFCTEEMLAKFKKFQFIAEYIERKKKEIAEYNRTHEVDESELINGRRLTNIGTFRAYVVAYLRSHPKIHQDMTFLIRHLQPTAEGLPIEIYVFSNDQAWANYEAIQADIFDHILAVIPQFELRVFQSPTGADFQKIAKHTSPTNQMKGDR